MAGIPSIGAPESARNTQWPNLSAQDDSQAGAACAKCGNAATPTQFVKEPKAVDETEGVKFKASAGGSTTTSMIDALNDLMRSQSSDANQQSSAGAASAVGTQMGAQAGGGDAGGSAGSGLGSGGAAAA
jgi:hypothetical protein